MFAAHAAAITLSSTLAMTLFAVTCAGIFPLAHTGRPWLAYWLFPYPNSMRYWPNFRSPLLWDVFAVSTYFTISAVFWFVGLLPDLATLRDTAKTKFTQTVYGAATMLRDSGEHPVILREAVTSPAGTTASAIRELERHGVRAAFLAAIEAARDRGRELGGG